MSFRTALLGLALALFLIDTLGPQGAAEFLYFKF